MSSSRSPWRWARAARAAGCSERSSASTDVCLRGDQVPLRRRAEDQVDDAAQRFHGWAGSGSSVAVWACPGPGERPTRVAQSAFPSHFCWRAALTSGAKPRVPCFAAIARKRSRSSAVASASAAALWRIVHSMPNAAEPVVEAAAAVAIRFGHQRRGERRQIEPRPPSARMSGTPANALRSTARSKSVWKPTHGASAPSRGRRRAPPAAASRRPARRGRSRGRRCSRRRRPASLLQRRPRSCRRAGCRRRRPRRRRSRAGGRVRDRGPTSRCRRRPSARPVLRRARPRRASAAARRAAGIHPG